MEFNSAFKRLIRIIHTMKIRESTVIQCMFMMYKHNAEQIHNIKTANKSFARVSSPYLQCMASLLVEARVPLKLTSTNSQHLVHHGQLQLAMTEYSQWRSVWRSRRSCPVVIRDASHLTSLANLKFLSWASGAKVGPWAGHQWCSPFPQLKLPTRSGSVNGLG